MSDEQIIIIGSGPTGAVAAWTLVRAGLKVALLESGDSFPKKLHIRVKGKEICQPYALEVRNHVPYPHFENLGDTLTRWIKAHLLGGLGNFWGGVVLRFAPEDFTQGELISEEFRWPIRYDDLAPYYQQVEQLIGVSGGNQSVPVLPACQVDKVLDIPLEFSDLAKAAPELHRWFLPINQVYGNSTIFSQIPSPINIGVRLLHQLRRQKNFRLISSAHVTRVQLHKTKALAAGVEYLDRETGELCCLSGRAVMLAAGQLGSTHILLNSCSGNGTPGIDNAHGLIGQYLHDNMYAAYLYQVDRPPPEHSLVSYLTRPDYLHETSLRTTGFQVYAGALNRKPLANSKLRINLGLNPQPLQDEGFPLLFACFGTQIPEQSRCVSLHPDAKDEYGLPLLRINTHYDSADIATLEAGRQTAEELMNIAGWQFSPKSSAIEPLGTSVHFGGTIRMHDNPKLGVVNRFNAMHEIPNIFVIDASCFTTCVEKNPTLTAMAMAMRAADLLSQKHSLEGERFKV
jgi:choline dehydrogenase-like flavoprotein